MSTSNKVFELRDLSVKLTDQLVLAEVTLNLEPAKIYTVLGPSGTGKSTLLKVMAGLLPFSAGQLTLGGQPYEAKQQTIGLVPQNYGLLPWQTTWQAVSAAVKISEGCRSLTAEKKEELAQLLRSMDLFEQRDAYPSELSGGQQQRVSIARAFAIRGDLLLMDEPFSALDAFTREKAQQLFLDTWSQDPKTTLFITHDIEEAVLLGHQIILLSGQPGRVMSVKSNPFNSRTKKIATMRNETDFYQVVTNLRKEIQGHEK